MQLLVSVRSAREVGCALAGGADIIDAKEPDRGSLGPVSAHTLAGILARVPSSRGFSVALGDLTTDADVEAAITALDLPARPAPTFLKLGFAGATSPESICLLLTSAVRLAAELPAAPLIVAVAYADARQAETVSAELVCRSAQQAGAAGVLIDTYSKGGLGLLEWLSPPALAAWVADVRRAGLLAAVAGGLALADLDAIEVAAPDVVDFRGAACVRGRSGQVSEARVAGLRRHLDRRPWPRPAGAWQNA